MHVHLGRWRDGAALGLTIINPCLYSYFSTKKTISVHGVFEKDKTGVLGTVCILESIIFHIF